MRTMHYSIGARLIAITLALGCHAVMVQGASALTSTSYQLDQNYGQYNTGNGGDSATYNGENSGMTWFNTALTSTSYQLTNGGTDAAGSSSVSSSSSSVSSSSSSVSSSVASSSSQSSATSTGGGSRGDRAGNPVVSSAASASAGAMSTSASSSSRSRKPLPSRPAAPVFEVPAISSSSKSALATDATGGVGSPVADDLRYSFFDGVDHACVRTTVSDVIAHAFGRFVRLMGYEFPVVICVALLSILAAWFIHRQKKDVALMALGVSVRKKTFTQKQKARLAAVIVFAILTSLIAIALPLSASAENQTTPLYRAYNGTLLDSSGNPVTSAVQIRFSYWKSADYVSTDTTGTGAINTGATNYGGWNEVQTVTPSSKGAFSVNLGSVTPLVDFTNLPTSTLLNLHLQVEVKANGAPDTSYELLDIDASSSTLDRSRVSAVPFARNADLLDQHDTGTGSYDIPVLEFGGKLPLSTIPGGTNLGTFTIDQDNSETSEIALVFGDTLGKKLSYNITRGLFIFNASVEIQGNLTVTGLVNGVDIDTLSSSDDRLKSSSGGGLSLNVSAGSYRLAGVVVNYAGGNKTLTANTTNYVFFGSGGLTVNTTGFPTDESYIAVSEVATSAGSITNITDRRVTATDDRERSVISTFTPSYEKATYQGDGGDNVGQLSVSADNITLSNFYLWTSTRETLQDYDLLLRVPVSSDFVRWTSDASSNPLSFTYRTTGASSALNKLDIQVYDTNGTPVTLSGSTTNLTSTSWATAQIEFTGSPVWTAGEDMLIRMKFSAKDSYQAHLGTLKLRHVDLVKE